MKPYQHANEQVLEYSKTEQNKLSKLDNELEHNVDKVIKDTQD